MEFSKNLDFLQKRLGLSTSGLEKKLGLGNGYIAQLLADSEKSIKNPGKLLVALVENNISTDWFLTGKGEMFLNSTAVVKPEAGHKIPLLRQKVSCGSGVDWQDESNIVEYIDVFDLIPHLKIKRLFALCVEGSSMLGAGIRNGDYVLFDSDTDQWVRDGVYVFALDGEVFCKRLEFDGLSKIKNKIKVFSVRVADLEKAELLTTLDMSNSIDAERIKIFGRVLYWVHPNLE